MEKKSPADGCRHGPGPAIGCAACVEFGPDRPDGRVSRREKYDSTRTWDVPCEECGEPVTVSNGSLEVIGPYHSGCFGWPACGCIPSHKGDCPVRVRITYPAKRCARCGDKIKGLSNDDECWKVGDRFYEDSCFDPSTLRPLPLEP